MNKSTSVAGTTALLLLSVNFFTACGGGDSGPEGGQGGSSAVTGQGGSGATGGHSSTGGAAAGSGSLVAAMSLHFLSGGVNCPIAAGYNDFPDVSGGHPVSATGATVTTPDNVTSPRGLVTLQCGIGAVVGVSIGLGGGAESMAFHVSQGTVSGNLQYAPLNSSVTYHGTSAAPCSIAAISTTATGGLYSISCPTLTGDDGSTCVLGESYVYFSGCTTQ